MWICTHWIFILFLEIPYVDDILVNNTVIIDDLRVWFLCKCFELHLDAHVDLNLFDKCVITVVHASRITVDLMALQQSVEKDLICLLFGHGCISPSSICLCCLQKRLLYMTVNTLCAVCGCIYYSPGCCIRNASAGSDVTQKPLKLWDAYQEHLLYNWVFKI